MTVNELIEELTYQRDKECCGDMEVGFTYGYGDHWNTEVVANLCQQGNGVHIQKVRTSDYHRMMKLVDEDNEETRTNEKEVPMLVLHGCNSVYHTLTR